jgi:hypothetical protein
MPTTRTDPGTRAAQAREPDPWYQLKGMLVVMIWLVIAIVLRESSAGAGSHATGGASPESRAALNLDVNRNNP